MIVDANILLYSRNSDDPRHERARRWLTDVLNGPTRIGLPWQSLTAFLRIATNPRAFADPLDPEPAFQQVEEWLDAPRAWIPGPTHHYRHILGELIHSHHIRGPLVTDAQLAALAIDHGVPLASTDADFARFPEVAWTDPLAGD